MNISDDKLNVMINKTENHIQRRRNLRLYITAACVFSVIIATLFGAVQYFGFPGTTPDITVETSADYTAASENTAQPTYTPLPDGTVQDSSGATALPSDSESYEDVNILWQDFNETQEIDDIIITVNVKLRTVDIIFLDATYSVFEVVPGEFDLEFAKKAVEYFFGDEYYENTLTKSDWEMKYQANKDAYELRAQSETLTADEQNSIQENLNRILAVIEDAPQNNILGSILFDENGFLSLKGYISDNCISYLSIYNGNESIGSEFTFMRGDITKAYEPSIMYPISSSTDGEAINSETYAFIEMEEMASELVDYLADDMSYVFNSYGNAYNPSGNSFSLEEIRSNEDAEKCYYFYYTREYTDQITSTLATTGVCSVDPISYTEAAIWGRELIVVAIDEEGIVSFKWYNKTDTIKEIESDVELISADDAIEILKQNIFNTEWNLDAGASTEINIGNMLIQMVKIEEDGTYLMVPAYVFKGTQTSVTSDGITIDNYIDLDNANLFVINALDGTVISYNQNLN